MDGVDDHESYHVKIVRRERMVLTSVQTIYIRRNEQKTWRKLHTIEQAERELLGEAKEERQIMSGQFIKAKFEVNKIRRKRHRPQPILGSMDSPQIDSKRERVSDELNSNSFNNDKENSILDEILASDHQQGSLGQVAQPNPTDFGTIFDDQLAPMSNDNQQQQQQVKLKTVSTPLKMLSPNKQRFHKSAIETPQKGLTPTKLNSPVIKHHVIKNLDRALETTPNKVNKPPRAQLTTPSPKKKLHVTPKKVTPLKPSTSGLNTENTIDFSNTTRSFSTLDDTPVRSWNGDAIEVETRNYLKRSEQFKQLKMLDQSSHHHHESIMEESLDESLEPVAPPEMPKRHESRCLQLDTLIWAKYGDGYYPAYIREILDPRSPKVKVSFCDQEMADVVMSVNIVDCLLFADLTKHFERLIPVMARNVDSKAPHLWADVQIHDYWGMRNHNLSTEEGRHACSTSAGYMVKYNHTVFKLVPFSDVAIKQVDGIEAKFADYKPEKTDINLHNLPVDNIDMVTANIIATPRRKRAVVSNSPHHSQPKRTTANFLEGIYFVFMRRAYTEEFGRKREEFEQVIKDITECGGRIIADINAFDMKTIGKNEDIYCIAEVEKATPRYLSCLVYQIQVCRPKWIDEMLKKKEFIQPVGKRYVLREKEKYKVKLFQNRTFHLALAPGAPEDVAAQLVLSNGASVTKLNGKDYFRHEGESSTFIYVSDGSTLIQPEKNTRLVNLNWLTESILQAKFLSLDKYPVDEKIVSESY